MAVIPPDAGVRLRMQVDNQLQALAPVRAVAGDLPELQPGQAFTARIQELLPDNTYRALVAGKQLTLQLPEGATAGDTLELTVIDRSGKTLIAQRTDNQPAITDAETRSYPYAKISDAGRTIGQLLSPEGETPSPAALSRGQPIVARPPVTGTELAPALEKAVSQSGLFYEAHQAQWVAGSREIASLRAEPQGQLPAMPRQLASQNSLPGALPPSPDHLREPAGQESRSIATPQLQSVAGKPEPTAGRSEGRPQPAATTSATNTQAQGTVHVPDEVRPLVQQQLDAVATQRLAWHGEVWPGQTMDWTIQRDVIDDRDAASETEETPRWSTFLRLSMPRLGAVDATLQLSGNRLRLRLTTTATEAASDLRQQMPGLAQGLANAGLTMQSFDVNHES